MKTKLRFSPACAKFHRFNISSLVCCKNNGYEEVEAESIKEIILSTYPQKFIRKSDDKTMNNFVDISEDYIIKGINCDTDELAGRLFQQT